MRDGDGPRLGAGRNPQGRHLATEVEKRRLDPPAPQHAQGVSQRRPLAERPGVDPGVLVQPAHRPPQGIDREVSEAGGGARRGEACRIRTPAGTA